LLPAHGRHDGVLEDPHAAFDKKVLSAKIDEDYFDKRKVLERPDTGNAVKRHISNNNSSNQPESFIKHVETTQNIDSDDLRQRRNKIKEVSVFALNIID